MATACAAMPSPRPVKPSLSVVVALMLTRLRRDAEDRGDPLDHRRAIGADLRPLADDRHVDRSDRTPSLADELGGVSEKLVGGGTPPARIAGWEMHPDIAGADGAEHRVGQSVETDIGVGVTDEARLMRDVDCRRFERDPRAEGVHVEALTDANIALAVP